MTDRLPPADPARMDPAQRALYELFTTGPRAAAGVPFALVDPTGRLVGPPSIWVQNPPLGQALERLGATVRFAATLAPRAREIAILMVAHHHRSEFEWFAHERAGAAAGLSPEDLAALAAGQTPTLTTDEERIVATTARRILATGTLTDAEYAEAEAALTTPRLVELVTLLSFYTMVAMQLSVFGVRPPQST